MRNTSWKTEECRPDSTNLNAWLRHLPQFWDFCKQQIKNNLIVKLELLLFSIPKMKFDVTERIYGIHNMAGNAINKAQLQHLQKMVMKKKWR